MRGTLRGLQADSERRKEGTHQKDGDRRALEETAPHEGSLPREGVCGVMYVTEQAGDRARLSDWAQTPKIRHANGEGWSDGWGGFT
jgi:hypothetical protein